VLLPEERSDEEIELRQRFTAGERVDDGEAAVALASQINQM
jgi:hypothetical protein